MKGHNDSVVTEGSFKDVEVRQADIVMGSTSWPLEYTCFWCGGTAFFVVSRTSILTGAQYSDHACTTCARRWVSPNEEQIAVYDRTKWSRMAPGHWEQFRERVSESRREVAAKLSPEERRQMTAAARAAAAAKRSHA